MELGMIGLGRMGANMAQRLMQGGHSVTGFDPNQAARESTQNKGVETVASLQLLSEKLQSPRVLWLMVPAGDVVDKTIALLLPLLTPGDTLIDGGNSNYKDSQRRAKMLAEKNIPYIDCVVPVAAYGACKKVTV